MTPAPTTETKHTAGPWVRHDAIDYAEIHPADGKGHSAIALVGKPEDADLIAAAPDLLEAVQAAVNDFAENVRERDPIPSWLGQAVAAIAKAVQS